MSKYKTEAIRSIALVGHGAAGLVEHVDHLRLDALQTELKHLEQAHRPGPDDQGVGVNKVACSQGVMRGQLSEAAQTACRSCLSTLRLPAAQPCVW